VRESLVNILEHQDEAQGNKDTTKALILKAKQVKMRYNRVVPFPCAKAIPKRDQTSTFSNEKKLRKKWSPFYQRADKEFQSTVNLYIKFSAS